MIGAIASAVGSAYLNRQATKRANKQSRIATAKQMAFQTDMSNTSYQRGMEDMRKAGLNPILAGKMGGATTPTGASYVAQKEDPVGASLQGVQTASAKQQLINQREVNRGQQITNDLNKLDLDALKRTGLSPMQMKHTVFNQAGSEIYSKAKSNITSATDAVTNSLDQTTGYFRTLARDIKKSLNTSAKESDILRILINTKQYNERKRKFNKRLRNNK